jgi:hypothetical protein
LTELELVKVPIRLTNIPGRGGGNAWDYLRSKPGRSACAGDQLADDHPQQAAWRQRVR